MFKIYFRYDDVEIRVEGEMNHAAKVRFFLRCLQTNTIYALVQQWYKMDQSVNMANQSGVSYFHPTFQVPHCKLMNRFHKDSYQLVEANNIAGHAHIISDFDTPGYFWWDLVNQEQLTYEE